MGKRVHSLAGVRAAELPLSVAAETQALIGPGQPIVSHKPDVPGLQPSTDPTDRLTFGWL